MAADPLVSVSALAFGFPPRSQAEQAAPPLFSGLYLQIERGSFTAIMGASGCGKSTLLRLIAGLLRPSQGAVTVHSANDPRHFPVAMMFQDARLLPWRPALGNVRFGMDALPLSKEEKKKRCYETLKVVGLEKLAHRYPHQLSGGQRQRVALARALAVDPELLLMDEPFGSLDAITCKELHLELVRLWKETRKTILFVRHDAAEAEFLAQRVIRLDGLPAAIVSDTLKS
jgi:NitT/TauT family transport system ATP-binding protein